MNMGKEYATMSHIDRQETLKAFGLSEKTRKYNTLTLYEIQDILESIPDDGYVEWLEDMIGNQICGDDEWCHIHCREGQRKPDKECFQYAYKKKSPF